MRSWLLLVSAFWFALQASSGAQSASPSSSDARVFRAHGVIQALKPETLTVVIQHAAITNFMDAMTMGFKVKNQAALAGLQRGDEITFQLHVAETESWADQLSKIGTDPLPMAKTEAISLSIRPDAKNELLHYQFTNELGQAVSLSDFPGQALAITFFYTRCPLPDYCPRLAKNFQTAAQKLAAMTNAPTNWHFLSISFDTEFDSPAMLRAYGEFYQYPPAHWSFLTGPADKIRAVAQRSGVTVSADGVTFNHNFRTLIIDASGHLQMEFVTGGDLSDQIVAEIIKAAGVTNPGASRNIGP